MPPSKQSSDPGLTAKGEPRQFVKHAYKDRANEEDGPLSKKDEVVLSQYDEDRVGGTFPLKLHIILKILEKEGKDHIFSWLPHGRAFGIHKPGMFEEEVMKRFFKQSQISSFRRQLNLYGFLRLSNGRDSGSYYHELFLRGRPLLSMKMVRTRIKGTKIRASSSPADEPHFYSMPYLGPSVRPSSNSPLQQQSPNFMNASLTRSGMGMENSSNLNLNYSFPKSTAYSPKSDINFSQEHHLAMMMENRNLMNTFIGNGSRSSCTSPTARNALEMFYQRNQDQGIANFMNNNNSTNIRNQLLNSSFGNRQSSNLSSLNSNMGDVRSLMAQARYLNELAIRQNIAGMMPSPTFLNTVSPFTRSPSSSDLMAGLQRKAPFTPSHAVEEDIAVSSMLSLSGDSAASPIQSLEV